MSRLINSNAVRCKMIQTVIPSPPSRLPRHRRRLRRSPSSRRRRRRLTKKTATPTSADLPRSPRFFNTPHTPHPTPPPWWKPLTWSAWLVWLEPSSWPNHPYQTWLIIALGKAIRVPFKITALLMRIHSKMFEVIMCLKYGSNIKWKNISITCL